MREYTLTIVDSDFKNKPAVVESCKDLSSLGITTKLSTSGTAMDAEVLRCELTITLPDDIKIETGNKKVFEIPDLKKIVEAITTQIRNQPYTEEPARRP